MPLWLRRNNNTGTNSRTVQVTLANTVTGTIGSATQTLTTLPSSGSPALVNFVIPNPTTATFPAGSAFRVTITQTAPTVAGRTTLVYPVGATAGNYSRVVLNSATVVNVDSVQTFNAAYSGGAAQASFAIGSTVYVRAVISDPFGSFDIASARISITDAASVVRVANAALPQVADSGAATRTYEYAYVVPAGAPPGGWSAQITGVEGTEGDRDGYARRRLRRAAELAGAARARRPSTCCPIPSTVPSNPYQIPGSVQRYRVTVTNTGVGARRREHARDRRRRAREHRARRRRRPRRAVLRRRDAERLDVQLCDARDVLESAGRCAAVHVRARGERQRRRSRRHGAAHRAERRDGRAPSSGNEPSFSVEFRVRVR